MPKSFGDVKGDGPIVDSVHDDDDDNVPLRPAPYRAASPSIALLFSPCTRRDFYCLLLPAIIVSLAAGAVAPFMTYVIGHAFNAFATFPLTSTPAQSDKDRLRHDVATVAFELIGLAGAALALSGAMSSLWLWVGERIVMRVRHRVFTAVTSREMEWFDLLGESDTDAVGAGGLMAKFTRDTDDVRMAASLNTGMLIQYLTTFLTALILAFVQSWSLTLVILASIPVMVIVQGLSQSFSVPAYNDERGNTAKAATHIDRAISSIATVKAFNAHQFELASVSDLLDVAQAAYKKCAMIWGAASGFTQFTLFAMFVQGFWFGAKLVRDGHITPGTVMTVFWACLIASSNLQMCMPLLIVLTKGKSAMASLHLIINPPPRESNTPPPYQESFSTIPPMSPEIVPSRPGGKKMVPSRCLGTFDIHAVSFSYASRPSAPVLSISSSIHIAGNDLTFIVGGSGSGKSTLAQLLMSMYEPTSGHILFDEQDITTLDREFLREHIALVSQECILFDMSVHDNVAIGVAGSSRKRPEDVTREEVERACAVAMVHDFVKDLPDGYDTKLGNGGANLSGGQRQRVALARAVLRDPTVLILDEATSALDATSRVLVFEALKNVRRRKTTVVITHDLSQITAEDYVYVMRDGGVVEEGFREDLEKDNDSFGQGEFRKTLEKQAQTGGFPVRSELPNTYEVVKQEAALAVDRVMQSLDDDNDEEGDNGASSGKQDSSKKAARRSIWAPTKHQSIIGAALSASPWEIDAIHDIIGPSQSRKPAPPKNHLNPYRLRERYQSSHARPTSLFIPARDADVDLDIDEVTERDSFPMQFVKRNVSTTSLPSPAPDQVAFPSLGRRSMTFEPSIYPTTPTRQRMFDDDFDEVDLEKMEASAIRASGRRGVEDGKSPRERTNWAASAITITPPEHSGPAAESVPSFVGLIRQYLWTVPDKGFIMLGFVFAIMNGALTPVFSFLLARLLAAMGSGWTNTSDLTRYGLLVLLVAFVDGLANGLKFFILEHAALKWVVSLRKRCYDLVLRQDKAWFDENGHGAERMVQVLIKDGDDARTLIATVIAQALVVITMVLVGLIWALVQGWQLTLVGIAIGPVFAVAMMVQSTVTTKFEVKNKRAREDVARRYYEAVSNVRAIRSMALESVFARQFDDSLEVAMRTGVQGAFVAGFGYGVANSLIYLAEALLFYVGAIFMARGTYSYLRLVEVLNLVVFSVAIAAQMLTFVPKIAKAKQAAADFGKILALTTETAESRGTQRFPIDGDIAFENVDFAYPQRPDVPIFTGLSAVIGNEECVAIVGASGAGKSTTAALLQRLYEPLAGRVTIGGYNIRDADTTWLREHVAVVSQTPALFDATIAENIAYGQEPGSVTFDDIERAARDAHIHNFIMSLPKGYDAVIGENAALLSGGQAQRLQIARALVNGRARIMIFDECTSALDSANQEAVMRAIMSVRKGRTALLITHKLPVMQMCDRILVVSGGRIVEEGTYDELLQRRGTFFRLANAGEWAEFE